jgi:hypothetical protein
LHESIIQQSSSPSERPKLERGKSALSLAAGAGSAANGSEIDLEKVAPNGLIMQNLTNTLKNWVDQEIRIAQDNNNLGTVHSLHPLSNTTCQQKTRVVLMDCTLCCR